MPLYFLKLFYINFIYFFPSRRFEPVSLSSQSITYTNTNAVDIVIELVWYVQYETKTLPRYITALQLGQTKCAVDIVIELVWYVQYKKFTLPRYIKALQLGQT